MKFYVNRFWYTANLQDRTRQVPSESARVEAASARAAFAKALGFDLDENIDLPVEGDHKQRINFVLQRGGKHASHPALNYAGPAKYASEDWVEAVVTVHKTYDYDSE